MSEEERVLPFCNVNLFNWRFYEMVNTSGSIRTGQPATVFLIKAIIGIQFVAQHTGDHVISASSDTASRACTPGRKSGRRTECSSQWWGSSPDDSSGRLPLILSFACCSHWTLPLKSFSTWLWCNRIAANEWKSLFTSKVCCCLRAGGRKLIRVFGLIIGVR